MIDELKELYKYRELLYVITYRDIKVRYKQSVMGFLMGHPHAHSDCHVWRRGSLCLLVGCASRP